MNFIFFSLGVMFLQLVHILMNYVLFKKKEFFYFFLAFVALTIFFIIRIYLFLNDDIDLGVKEKYVSAFSLVFLSFAMYYKFIRNYLDLAIFYPRFNKAISIAESILILVAFLILVVGLSSFHHFSLLIFKYVYFLTIPFKLTFIFYLGTRGKKLNSIIMFGTLSAMLIIRVSLINNIDIYGNHQPLEMWNFQVIMGSILLLFLFMNFALIYKSRLYQQENIKLEIQKHLELSQQRTAISADLHDDLGASLSSIHLNAILAQKILQEKSPEINVSLSKMVNDLKLVMENMGDIVWAINTSGYEQKSLSSQLKDFYFELMESQNLQCHYHIDEVLEGQITDINARKNLLLIAKEAINNILKHARSSAIDISLSKKNDYLLFEIQDNGIGMNNIEAMKSGNGLRNMRFRAEKLNGTCTFSSVLGAGTTISCLVPLTNISYNNPIGI
jgi:signal transduction histidine kinase